MKQDNKTCAKCQKSYEESKQIIRTKLRKGTCDECYLEVSDFKAEETK